MTGSTAHNLKVIGQVAEELINVDHILKTLLYNVHPLMMFQRKIKELCQVIYKYESFVVKSIKCLSNFINQDYSAEPWNRSSHFASFIVPKKINRYLLKTIDSIDLKNVH